MNTKWLQLLALLYLSAWMVASQAQSPVPAEPALLLPGNLPTSSLTPELLKERRQIVTSEHEALLQAREQQIAERKALPERINELERMTLNQKLIDEASLNLENDRVELDKQTLAVRSAEDNLEKQRKNLENLQKALENLKKTIPAADVQIDQQQQQIERLKQDIALQEESILLQKDNLSVQIDRQTLNRNQVEISERWYNALSDIFKSRQALDKESQTQRKQQRYLNQAAALRNELNQLTDDQPNRRILLEAQIQVADEQAQQVQRDWRLDKLQHQLDEWKGIANDSEAIVQQTQLDNLSGAIGELSAMYNALQRRIEVLAQQQEVLRKRQDNLRGADLKLNNKSEQVLTELNADLQTQLNTVRGLLYELSGLEEHLKIAYKSAQRRLMLRLRSLPQTEAEWLALWIEVRELPDLLWVQLRQASEGLWRALQQNTVRDWVLLNVALLVWLNIFIMLRSVLRRVFQRLSSANHISFTARSILFGLELLSLNARALVLSGVILLILWLSQPNSLVMTLTLALMAVWLGIRFPLHLIWLLLSNRHITRTRNRSRLYRFMRATIITTGLTSTIVIVAHLLPVSRNLRDLVDTAFMLYLGLTVLPLMHSRALLLEFLSKGIKSYWLWVIRIVSLLFPMGVLSVAVLGTLGYTNLGWKVAEHLSLFVVVLTSWLAARRLLGDLIVLAKNFALRNSKNGLLWTQDIIPIFHNLLELGLLLLAVLSLFWINSWQRDVLVLESIEKLMNYALFSLGDSNITVSKLLLALLSLTLLFWFGSWCRRVTYRWIYLGISDLGARNSLSVFTQYAIVLIGVMIVLRTVGVDLTTLTVFAGAMGVGIGLGLQDIARNFIGGLLLLLERPLRTGDIVTLGEQGQYEGTVTHIGVNSLTIQDWDYEEVIVPNAQLLNNAFVNRTHSNDFMRTTLFINIHYQDDPQQVLDMIENMLKDMTNVVKEPPFQAILWEFASFSMVVRIDYFIDLARSNLFHVRSLVLVHLWQTLKAAGIQIPYPQQDVHLKKNPSDKPAPQMYKTHPAPFDDLSYPHLQGRG